MRPLLPLGRVLTMTAKIIMLPPSNVLISGALPNHKILNVIAHTDSREMITAAFPASTASTGYRYH